jgi:hypothetical protein
VDLTRLKHTNAGAVLAIAAGLFSIAVTTWPAPVAQGTRGDLTAAWVIAVRVCGAAVVAAPFLASAWPGRLGLAKLVLAAGGLGLVAAAVAGQLAGGGPAELLLNAVPGLLALIAAWLLVPLRRPEVERAKRAEAAGRTRRGPPR